MRLDGVVRRLNVDPDKLRDNTAHLVPRLLRTKRIDQLQGADEGATDTKLKKCLTTLDLTSLGVGSCVGTGMYLVAGMVARKIAGPGVIFSFIIAAVASIFSGACYAEFGVRVPHTSGSAYMYSYVSAGEFVAFVIGWNMVLEYLIGTAACACALSACLDTLSNGAITKATGSVLGNEFGSPPDVLAFVITLLMTLVMAAGVRKSLVFNNVLNAVNLAAWVFFMSAGLFYVDTSNWTDKGFLPYGWSGVLSGAATCFYAFIGFDIIATTGEEATNPKKSIPFAIVGSLIIILIAYVTSSIMLTLIVPYSEADANSGLVEMFGQVGAFKSKYIVGVGALAGLSVSMFGSMFPMPRIVYAMASDGLVFRPLSQVWSVTGTPLYATIVTGIAASLAALLIKLDVLVEMMSIGTLLAYTLVSTCVLVLRYQPHSSNLIELLPQSIRTPLRGSPSKDPMVNGQVGFGTQMHSDQLRTALNDTQPAPQPPTVLHAATTHGQTQRVMIRRVTRSSPDSDDTYPGEELEEDLSMRDDRFLVSDTTDNKFYGTVHGGGGCSGLSAGGVGATMGSSFGYIGRKLQEATYLCPGIFPWVDRGPATTESGKYVCKLVGILYALIMTLDLTVAIEVNSWNAAASFFLSVSLIGIVCVLLLISRKPQNNKILSFMTPGLPWIPAIAITVNIYLICKLSYLTLVRFTLWMTLGFILYFYYGIKNSSLEAETRAQEAEMAEATEGLSVPVPPGLCQSSQPPAHHYAEVDASMPTRTSGDLFIAPQAFPSWDD